MTKTIVGLLLPFECRSRRCTDDGLYERVQRGAVTVEALAAQRTRFNVDHGATVPAVTIRLLAAHVGIIAQVRLPDGAPAESIFARQSRWRGLSVGFPRPDATHSAIEWASLTWVMTRLEAISQVSLCVNVNPAYPETWALPFNTAQEKAAAAQRVRQENERSLASLFGSDYKRTAPKAWWTTPRQAAWAETHLCARDAERAMLLQFGEI